jgi:iron complex transport system substrate-binding protein
MTRPSFSRRLVASSILLALAASGCGAKVENGTGTPPGSGSVPSGPVTVTDCGKEVTYDKVPERAVSYDIGMTEQLFSLGLAPKMRGYVIQDVYKLGVQDSKFQDEFKKVERLGDSRISLEIVLNSKADWVYGGHGYGFAESRGITPAILANNGVASYVLSESCANDPGSTPLKPLDALHADYRNLGKIFHVENKAESVIADIDKGLADAGAKKPATPPRVLVFDAYEDKPFVAGGTSLASLIVEKAGGKNINDDVAMTYDSVGWEDVVAKDPEVIVVVDYDIPYEQKKNLLFSTPQMANVAGVKEKNIYRVGYADIMPGPRAGETARKFGEYLRSIGK